ncbi:MAG: hypothetical protein GTN36_02900 [Candidatus Aenigmarchaeota archaeon]|nr:hypothetical protein [Candidatus Aenigmarchaeota archaeon]
MNKKKIQELRKLAEKLENLQKSGNDSLIPESYEELLNKVVSYVKEETGITEEKLPKFWTHKQIPATSHTFYEWSVGCEELGEMFLLDIKKGTLRPFKKEIVEDKIYFVDPN